MDIKETFLLKLYFLLQKLKEQNLLGNELPNGNQISTVDLSSINDEITLLKKLKEYGFIYNPVELQNVSKCVVRFNYEFDSNFDELVNKFDYLIDDPFLTWENKFNTFKTDFKKLISYQITKNEIFLHEYGSVSVDRENSKVKIFNISYNLRSDTKPFKYLETLIDAKGISLDYKEISARSGFILKNDTRENTEDFAEDLKNIKKNLGRELRKNYPKDSAGFKAVDTLMNNIKNIKKFGYKLEKF